MSAREARCRPHLCVFVLKLVHRLICFLLHFRYTRIHSPGEAYRYPHAEQSGCFAQVGGGRSGDGGGSSNSEGGGVFSGGGRRIVAPPLILQRRQWEVVPAVIDARRTGELPWLQRMVVRGACEAVRERHTGVAALRPVNVAHSKTSAAPAPSVTSSRDVTPVKLLRPRL